MFTFSLQTLLDYRKRREEERQVEMAEAGRKLSEEARKLEAICAAEQENLLELGRVADQASPVSLVAALLVRGKRLGEERRQQEDALAQAKAFLDECRDRLAEAMKEKEMLEKLKETRMKAYLADEARRETKAVDEAARSAARYRGKQ